MNKDYNLLPETILLLRDAGWFPDRRLKELPQFPAEFSIFPEAEIVLREFGGLHVRQAAHGRYCSSCDIDFDPMLADGFTLRGINSSEIFPLGAVGNGYALLYMLADGSTYVFEDTPVLYAYSVMEGIERLLLGLLPEDR